MQAIVRQPPPPSAPTSDPCCLSPSGLRNGMHIVGGPGVGKSLLEGDIAWQHLVHGQPQVIVDPTGSVGNYLLGRAIQQSKSVRKQLWARLRYLEVGASDYVTPTPLYYRLSDQDTLFAIADRLPSIIQRQDPDLQSAPILGWNALYECAIHAGKLTAVLERQLDFVADLIFRPGSCKNELKEALIRDASLATEVKYFRDMMDPDRHALREKQTGSFRTKLLPFVSDERFLASFCGRGNGIEWEDVIANGHTVLLDLSQERNPSHRQFQMLWQLKTFTDFIKYRGIVGREQPVTLIIDEITQLLGQKSLNGQALLAEDLEELVAVLARNMGVNVIIAHQNLSQVDERIQNVLMQLGTQLIGNITTYEDARRIAQTLFPYNPKLVKKEEMISARDGYRTWEYTPDEQVRMATDAIMQLPKLTFLARIASEEGTLTGPVRKISIAKFVPDQAADPQTLAQTRAYLRQKWGVPVKQLLDDINQRRAPLQLEQTPLKPKAKKENNKSLPKDATIGATAHDTRGHAVPRTTIQRGAHAASTPSATPAPTTPTDEEGITWR